ncbi:MAG: hypothetical protein F6K50_03260 [Moorea sp. SIO3I7]|uniref:hypothetical protein n=1 Tax=Moorena sp. SIO3I8 TaxID=2607833 RepID=UPI0013BFDE4D|nr:hypothetical protein [Moorena sp. SIO3I8]NEN94579.1 hypothetical protein [Moorena sp. SIO3I7]NEO07826.1 hypothetical protein [Moorena sp. SIO3I8]
MSREHDQANQTESPLAQRATLRERDKKEICGESFACPKITVLQKPLASKALIEPLLLVAVDNPEINNMLKNLKSFLPLDCASRRLSKVSRYFSRICVIIYLKGEQEQHPVPGFSQCLRSTKYTESLTKIPRVLTKTGG